MTWDAWLEFELEPDELIINASAVDGSDFHQPHPIGISVFLCPALPTDPLQLKASDCRHCKTPEPHWANAIFSYDTTDHAGGNFRRRLAWSPNLERSHIHKEVMSQTRRLSPYVAKHGYETTRFTISPRGAGLDCHRTYEALLFKSIPVIIGGDESLREKYRYLPVIFADADTPLTVEQFEAWYLQIRSTSFDFNYMSRKYWAIRRPDINIGYETVFWLYQFGMLDHMRQYLTREDQRLVDTLPKKRYYTA